MLVLAIHTIGLSSILGSINYILTFRYKRGISLSSMRTSIFTWSLIATSILIILSVPVLAVAVTFILLDKIYGLNYYDSGNGGDPLLYQHLFWFFGHPEVYIIILPIFGIITKMISVVSNKPPFNPMSMIAAIFTISIVGFGVWAHHMFTTGLTVDSRSYFSAATAIIGVPTAIKVFS